MAETFKLITGLPEDRPRVYNIAAKTTDEAMRYLRYLNRNALFGTHTGLPKKMRNSKENESLVSNIGDYSVIDVFAYPQTKCIIGTVVNFHISNDVNPLGSTYVYPCTDKDKPMGYMISDATPDTMGVCLVHGVIEVPLYYFSGSVEEKKDFVEYDIENSCFKFANSGYPVFNVYQDVDGDWIAIILFGDIASDYEYDGPFAASIAGITGSTLYVNVSEGDIVDDDSRYTCHGIEYDSSDLTTMYGLNTGETLWIGVYDDIVVGSTYSFLVSNSNVVDVDGHTAYYRIAENNNGEIRQLQYGDIFNYNEEFPYKGPFDVEVWNTIPVYNQQGQLVGMSGQLSVLDTSDILSMESSIAGHVIVGSMRYSVDGEQNLTFTCPNDTIADLYLYKDTDENKYKLKVIGRLHDTTGMSSIQGTFYTRIASFTLGGVFYQIQYGDVVQPQYVSDGTSSEVIQDLYSSLRIISGTTATSPAICLTESEDYVNIVGGTNTYVTRGIHGEIIVGSTYSYTPTYQALTHSVDGGTASVGITHSSSNVKFEGMGSVYLTQIRSSADITERESWGRRYNPETGEEDGDLKDAGWRGIIPLKIFDDSVPDDMVMTEISMHDDMVIDGSTVTVLYPLIVPDTTDEELGIIARCTINELDYPDEILEKAYNWAEARVNQGKSPFYNGEVDDEPLRNIPSADSIIVYGVVPSLMSHIVDNNVAVLEIAGSTSYVVLEAGDNVQITGADNILTISASGSTYTPTYQDLSASVSGTTATIGITNGAGFSLIPEGDTYVRSSSNGFILGSTHTPEYQNLTSASTTNGFTVGLSNSISSVTLTGGTNVTITSGTTGEFIINASGATGSSGGISLLEINWAHSYAFELYKNTEYWTGYDEDTPQGYSQIGNGYGGIIVGTIQGPSSVTSYGDGYSGNDDADSYRFEIQMNPLNGPVTNISLLHPKKTEVIIGSSIGYCYSPRQVSVWLVVPPNTEFKLIETPSPDKSITGSSYSLQFYPYNLLEQPEPEPEPVDYRVMQTSGTNVGSLFYGLSQRNDSNISVDSSLDGQSIDFEGASVL